MSNELLTKLSAPFHPSRVTWKPGALTGKKDKALALAYADVRAYQSRLDEVCGMDWSLSYTPWGDRIICHLTINGVTRSATGEADAAAERNENAGTSAEAQAMKRACAMFGLGRYLYNLPALWVDYDAANGRFTDQAKAKLQALIAQHYQRHLAGQPAAEAEEAPPDPGSEDVGGPDDATGKLRELLNEAGSALYGQTWPEMLAKKCGKLGVTNDALTADHMQAMIGGLRKLQAKRQAA